MCPPSLHRESTDSLIILSPKYSHTIDTLIKYKLCDVENYPIDYQSMYDESIRNPDKFWGTQANLFLTWTKQFDIVNDCKKDEGIVRWFTGGKLNVTSKCTMLTLCKNIYKCSCLVNCLDRHAVGEGKEKTALIWEKNRAPEQQHGTHEHISYG